jgi:hypothetical protein
MFDALVVLILQGELDHAEIVTFLRSAFTELLPQDQSHVWVGWQRTVAMLAFPNFGLS